MEKTIRGGHLLVSPLQESIIKDFLSKKYARNIILDLEAASKFSEKASAREACKQIIPYLREKAAYLNIAVRINEPKYKALCDEDLQAILPLSPDFLRIPGVEEEEEMHFLDLRISQYSSETSNKIKLHPMIESPRGFANIEKIAKASPRAHALCLGGEDWVNKLAIKRTRASQELFFIRYWISIYANQNNLHAVDSVYPWEDDTQALEKDCQQSVDLGFAGRSLKHVKQLPIANAKYSLSEEQISYYQMLLDKTEMCKVGDQTVYVCQDKIIDCGLYFLAERVLKS
jgi:citrate lyase subunit beta/citryl-CoA lyase